MYKEGDEMRGYDLFMMPLESLYLKRIRKKIMPKAYGKVLEIGFGNGANMKYYNSDSIEELHALDIKENMRRFKQVHYHILSAERLPFEDQSFDCVVATLALCSIDDQTKAIQEIYRILKEDGLYLFIEHELPQSKWAASLFKKINPLWHSFTKGCQLTFTTHKTIAQEGFKLKHHHKHIFHYGLAQKD